MSYRDKILNSIKLFETLLNYQDEFDDLKRELETITNDNVRNAVNARLIELAENKFSCEADVRTLAGMWVKYLEEK